MFSTTLPLAPLITAYQLRGKVFSYSQLYSLTGLVPSQIQAEIQTKIQTEDEKLNQNPNQTPPADPSLALTQSTKNYSYTNQAYFESYSNPANFVLASNAYGASNQLSLQKNQPTWASYTINDHWYWKQKQAEVVARWLYCLPFVGKIYLCSSSALEIASPNSDLDLMVRCRPNTCLIVRLITKTMLKIIGFDSYDWFFSVRKLWAKDKTALEQEIFDYKNRVGTKVDVGMFFENPQQILTKFEWQAHYLFVHYRLYIAKSMNDGHIFDDQANSSFGAILCTNTHIATRIFQTFFQVFCWLILPVFILLSPLQSLWQKVKKDSNPSFDLSPSFINFYPRFPEPKYLTRIS